MKPKTMILMIVAVVCGLGASYMTSRLLAERNDAPSEVAPIEKVKLLVAKKNIDMHSGLNKKPEDFFVEKDFVKDDAPKEALVMADMPKLKDKFLKRGLRKGDHLTADDLMDGNFGLTTLPDGMRAVGIPVSSQQTASGFACVPGSHVDIHWITRTGNDNGTVSKVLLEDVVVLAADTRSTNENGGAMPAAVVVVALHPDDSLKLTLAMETGSLRLVVRNLQDKSSGTKERISRDELLKDHSANKKNVDPIVGVVNPPEPELKVDPNPDLRVLPIEPPQQKLTKITVMVRNGTEVQLLNYWVDDQDRIVPPPGTVDQNSFDPVPAPAARTKIADSKGDGNKGG